MKKSSFKIWAIINLTPDSFYEKSRVAENKFLDQCINFLEEGADLLDIGAESTRPQGEPISEKEEWDRLERPLKILKDYLGPDDFFNKISIDTYKASIARKSLELGAGVINDVAGGRDKDMFSTLSDFPESRYVLMHSMHTSLKMPENPQYENLVEDIYSYLNHRTEKAIEKGVKKDNIIWDPGIGFSKDMEQNLTLIREISRFQSSGYPLLYGISRKSFIGRLLNLQTPEERKDPTIIIHTWLAMNHIDILRVHDVRETSMIRTILSSLENIN